VSSHQTPALVGRITTYEVELQKFPLVIKEREMDVEKLKKQIDDLSKLAATPEALAAAERDPEVAAKMFEAAKQKRDYEYIRSVANNPNSDKILRQKADMDKAETEANKLKTEKAALLDGQRNRDKSERLVQLFDANERDLRRLKESEQITKKMFEDAKKELSEFPPEFRKEDEKQAQFDPERTDLQSHDDMYKRIATQLIGLDFELQSPPRVRKLQDASSPSAKDPKKQIIMTVVAGLLGFGLMGLGAVGYETRAKKVSSLADLKSVGTTPVLGVVPWQPNAATANDPLKKADVTDAIDKLRSVVAQTWLTKGIRTIAISSPFADEGKAFTAFGLANSLAQSGYRTLLIDFDLRNPALHQFAGVPNVDGVCEMLRGECDPRAGQILLPSGLSLLPAGQWTDEMRRSAVGARLEFLLSEVRENFECVLLHGHGLLSVAESIEIVRRSDAVILCTLYRETRMPLLKRSIERLSTLEVTTSGIVYIGASPQESLC
jgi:polysaccharide biosynthesis transport protein